MPTKNEKLVGGISDEQAEQAAEIARLGMLGMQHEERAAYYQRIARIATVENPNVRESLMRVEFSSPDAFERELIAENDFREVPFGVVGGEGASDTISRAARRKEAEAENRHLTEDESYRRMLEAQSILGTEAEKAQAFTELAKLDDPGRPDISDIEA